MAISVSFKIEKKMKTFTKDDIYFADNIRAVKHSIVQADYWQSKEQTPEKYEDMQNDFCNMIADIFNNDFSGEQFKQGMLLSSHQQADDIFTLALGGKLEKEDDEEKK